MNHLLQSIPHWPFPVARNATPSLPNRNHPAMKHLYTELVYTFETTIDDFTVTGEARLEEFPDQPPFIWIDEVYLYGRLLPKPMVSDWLEKHLEDVVYQQWASERK